MRFKRGRYDEAIAKVRLEHRSTVTPASATLECPRCGTKQRVVDIPGMRKCQRCGFEFGRLT